MEWTVIEGEAWTYAAADGVEVVVSDGKGAPKTAIAAGGEGVSFSLSPGRHWIAARGPATGTLERLGVLDVVPLADPVERGLLDELAALDAQLADLDATLVFQRSNSDGGEAETRSQMTGIRKARRQAEARLADYRRQAAGRSPLCYL